ncbi:FCD domain-containing protein [Chelativorans sp. ZYF759]|uniref:GntR family transcriptional regulator n=1 Tax=Chelativorans sp. ZYF759 TaxID=2692213 RepID=UPI00145D5FC8|nr:FCD domain-containing protein [Chelativorans sp. ZYF759]NMG39738.1 FCD domain-containing protein [Chelativorans sp. ZYF759]
MNIRPPTLAEPSLVEQALDRLRSDIIAGTRQPGEKLRIERLRSLYGIGPSPLREALQRLAADGLVIVNSNRGFQVAPLDPDEFIDLNRARVAIETAALRLSIEHGDEDWEAGVVAAAYSLEKHDVLLMRGELQDFGRWELLNGRFHTALVEACGSRWLLKHRGMLQEQCERYRRASVYHARLERNLLEEHRAITKAVLSRDAEAACILVAEHFDRTADNLVHLLRNNPLRSIGIDQ